MQTDNEDDDVLMQRAQVGDTEAYETVVRRHQPLVLAFACRFLNDRALARDITQDVFLAVWADRMRYQGRGRFKAYLLTCTVNRCQTAVRGRRNLTHRLKAFGQQPSTHAATATPLDESLRASQAQVVQRSMATLSAAIRQALVLRYVNDLDLNEIAITMAKPVGTIKSYLFRGLQRLHGVLPQEVL